MAPFWDRLAYLFGRGPLAMPESAPATTVRDALRREVASLERSLAVRDEEADRLRQEAKLIALDRDVAREQVRLYAEVIERDRKRIQSEAACYAAKIADAERGSD